MVVSVKDCYRWRLAGKDIPYYRVYWRLVYRKDVENIDWGVDWGCTAAVDVVRWWGVYNCVGNSGNAWVLLEAVGLLGMRMQKAQLGYIVDKSPDRLWFESFCSSQEEWGRQ